MKTNIGWMDRRMRWVLGALILVAGYVFQSAWGLIGLIPLITAAIGFCPLYSVFGLNTAKAT